MDDTELKAFREKAERLLGPSEPLIPIIDHPVWVSMSLTDGVMSIYVKKIDDKDTVFVYHRPPSQPAYHEFNTVDEALAFVLLKQSRGAEP